MVIFISMLTFKSKSKEDINLRHLTQVVEVFISMKERLIFIITHYQLLLWTFFFFFCFAVRKMEGLSNSLERIGHILHCLTCRVANLIHPLQLHRNHTDLEMGLERCLFFLSAVSGFCIILM